jgi:hypothetical protein
MVRRLINEAIWSKEKLNEVKKTSFPFLHCDKKKTTILVLVYSKNL